MSSKVSAAAHDASFYRHLRQIEGTGKLSRADAQVIARAVNRGAISDERALHYMDQARAGADISALDLFAGRDGATASGAPDSEDEFSALWPAKSREQHEGRQRRRRQDASARQAWTDDDVYAALFPQEPRR